MKKLAAKSNWGWSALAATAVAGAALSGTSPARADEFTVKHTGADIAASASNATGSGITIAIIDSGIQNSKWDLQQSMYCEDTRVLTNVNFAPDNTTYDLCGHGTHVAGIAAGNGKASTGSSYFRTFYGIARSANLVNVRVLDGKGQGSVSSVISGIQWCLTNRTRYNIKVLNLSLGHPEGESYTTDPLCQAVEQAWKAGIVVVCAAGNNGRTTDVPTAGLTDNEGYGTAYGSIQSPGNDPYIITVGAMKSPDGTKANDLVTTYSSRGPSRLDFVMKPDIMAPGNRVISLTSANSYLDTTFAATNYVP